MNKNNYINKIFTIVLVIIWMIVIFVFSSKNTELSNLTSKKVLDIAVKDTLIVTNGTNITDKHPTEARKKEFVEKYNVLLRKITHASVYFVLSLFVVFMLKSYKISINKILAIAFFVCFLYAMTDEYHQTFVDGRNGTFIDVLIDMIGVIISVSIIKIASVIKSKKKKKVIFVSSIGGHLTQLLQMKEMFNDYRYTLITEKSDVTKSLKKDYRVIYYTYCNKENFIKYFCINVLNAIRSVITYIIIRPDCIVTTGANTSVPLCYLGALFGSKVIFIESFAKREGKTLAGTLVYPVATHFIVQWESMKEYYPKSIYFGGIY